jgi:hypothetical protein
MSTNASPFASSIERAAPGTDLKSNIGIAKMSLDQVVKILGKTPANYYLLFINLSALDEESVFGLKSGKR